MLHPSLSGSSRTHLAVHIGMTLAATDLPPAGAMPGAPSAGPCTQARTPRSLPQHPTTWDSCAHSTGPAFSCSAPGFGLKGVVVVVGWVVVVGSTGILESAKRRVHLHAPFCWKTQNNSYYFRFPDLECVRLQVHFLRLSPAPGSASNLTLFL